jgi:hypothetical protein
MLLFEVGNSSGDAFAAEIMATAQGNGLLARRKACQESVSFEKTIFGIPEVSWKYPGLESISRRI